MFQQTGGKYAKEMLVADGNAWIFGDTRIRFSTPVPHGSEGSGLGFVLMAIVECQDEMFMFAPDVQGPMAASTLELILNEKPQLLMVGGPPSYLADFKVDNRQIQVGLKNLEKIVERVPVVLLEHHFLRDLTWREKASALFRRAKKADTRIMTSAEFLGQPESFLEAFRKQLFNEDKPSTGFEKWMRGSEYARRLTKPPI
jgi:predicted metallo-beta-lactamase superfamily hydrolase